MHSFFVTIYLFNISVAPQSDIAMFTTSFLLSGIHSWRDAPYIQNALYSLRPRPVLESPSIVSSWVTVHHEGRLSRITIRDALVCYGFDVQRAVAGNPPQEELEQELEDYRRGITLQKNVSHQYGKRRSNYQGFQLVNPGYVRIKEVHTKISDLGEEAAETEYEYITGIKLWLVVASLTLACFLVMLDMSIVVTVSFDNSLKASD